jgi:ATPase subunit of ABC transporter with duplicated ATPase domains
LFLPKFTKLLEFLEKVRMKMHSIEFHTIPKMKRKMVKYLEERNLAKRRVHQAEVAAALLLPQLHHLQKKRRRRKRKRKRRRKLQQQDKL